MSTPPPHAPTPAAVLRFLRDAGPVSLAQVESVFAPQSPGVASTDMLANAARHHLAQLLLQLQRAELIEEGPALPPQVSSELGGSAHARTEARFPIRGTTAWYVTPRLMALQQGLGVSLATLAEEQARLARGDTRIWMPPPAHCPGAGLRACAAEMEGRVAAGPFLTDLVETLRQMATCLDHQCTIAVLALAGKVMERCLKMAMTAAGLYVDDGWMLGVLLRKYEEAGSAGRPLDAGLKNIANLVNQHRIPAVHAKEVVSLPSQDQAQMVAHATIEVVRRLLL